MRFRGCLLAAVIAALAVPAGASAAGTVTIGNVTPPSNATATTCPATPTQIIISDSTSTGQNPAYAVPSSGTAGLVLTQWQLNVTGATAGAQATLVVLNIDFPVSVTVVGTDTETLNPSAAADGVETFTLATPIAVQPGDEIGLYLPGATGMPCYWTGGSTPGGFGIAGTVVTTAPAAGQSISSSDASGTQAQVAALNLAATLAPATYDAALSMSAGPSNAVVGQPAVLTADVTNNGPDAGPITLTDTVPAGLTVDYAAAGSGSCAVAGSTVTCLFPSVGVGQSENAAIVVTPGSAKTFTDAGSVADDAGATDPNSANNNASTTLKVSAVAVPKCVVPKLGGASESLAKNLLSLLDCKVGKVKKATSKSVPKGDVISTSPGAGSYAAGKSIGIKISSGKPKPKKKKKKK
jgi:uncharacterized repeat protein (TIGR01451 family)